MFCCCLQVHCQKPPIYIRLKVLAAKVFSGVFYKVRTNCDTTKLYNKCLINLVCSVCTESIAFSFYRTDLASSFGLYEKTRQYFHIHTSYSVSKSLVIAIYMHYYGNRHGLFEITILFWCIILKYVIITSSAANQRCCEL